MREDDAALKILDVLKQKRSFIVLSELAKCAGFKGAFSADFKRGFNYLQNKGVVKLCRSGWKSEHRGGKNHPKSVVLNVDIYEVEKLDASLRAERADFDVSDKEIKECTDELVPVLTLSGDKTFVSKTAYDKALSRGEKGLVFWVPINTRDKRKMDRNHAKDYLT